MNAVTAPAFSGSILEWRTLDEPARAGALRRPALARREELSSTVARIIAQVRADVVSVLTSRALRPEEINVDKAHQELDLGHKMWNEAGDSEEAYTEALEVIAEAEAKLATAAEKH